MANFFHLFYIQIEIRLIRPIVKKITPLIGGTHLPIGRNDNSFGILEAKVPATNKGTICPIAKLPRKIVPLRGFPCLATQARRTARTGVVQGEEASPKAKPAVIGANEEDLICPNFRVRTREVRI